jgi:hypothetical protein
VKKPLVMESKQSTTKMNDIGEYWLLPLLQDPVKPTEKKRKWFHQFLLCFKSDFVIVKSIL